MAHKQLRCMSERVLSECRWRSGFSIMEVLAVFAALSLFISLVLPAMNLATESARKLACANKLRQIGIAYPEYITQFPSGLNGNQWLKAFLPELDPSGFECPSDRNDRSFTDVADYSIYIVNVSYSIMLKDGPWAMLAKAPTCKAANGVDCRTSYGNPGNGPINGSSNPVPGGYFCLFEDAYSWVVGPDAIGIFFWDADAAPRHLGGTLNVVFFDGHIETKTADEINPCVPWLHNLYWSPETMPIIPVPF